MSGLDKDTRKVIVITIRKYPERKKMLEEMQEDIILSKGTDSGHTNFDTEYSKPQSVTEAKALKLNNKYYTRLRAEVKAVEKVFRNLKPEHQKVIYERFWKNPKKPPMAYYKMDCYYSRAQMQKIVSLMVEKVGKEIGLVENE